MKEPKFTPLKIKDGIASGGQVEKEPKQSWEERLEKCFSVKTQIEIEEHSITIDNSNLFNSIKEIFSQEIQKAREETLKEVLPEEKEVKQWSMYTREMLNIIKEHNECRQKIINKAKDNWGIELS
jgi:ATP phosphoribosyltransferase regulatory subunit HisZ